MARLFVALWPGPAVRMRLGALAGEWPWSAGAQRVGEAGLHMTLHFLGHVPRHRLKLVAEGLVVSMQPFDLVLDRAEVWRNGVAILAPSDIPAGLQMLQRSLTDALRPLGLVPEARAFRPHVTLARHAQDTVPPQQFTPVRWPVSSYELVESPVQDSVVGYRHLRHYAAHPSLRVQESQPADFSIEQFQSGPVPL
ncbi:MAG TPA: RNA 2',3'-cyclic phosphodiesterase [Burkholderiaceae bacterium]|nr:RNA 2',3'-cyclic phosphodiesterase [Burkholderiaceae bacterium]